MTKYSWPSAPSPSQPQHPEMSSIWLSSASQDSKISPSAKEMKMMGSLFASFDPCSESVNCWGWVGAGVPLILWLNWCYLSTFSWMMTLSEIVDSIANTFNWKPGFVPVWWGLMWGGVLYANTIGLLPFTYSVTAQFGVALGISAPVWASEITSLSRKASWEFIAHLVPEGCPLTLAPFMVIIELVSLIVRPLTLSIRLSANITAGHLILAFAGGTKSAASALLGSVFVECLILVLEIAVCFIQAYVIITLLALYMTE